ncbi:MAG TPA: hypothetical protein VJZ75_11285 [Candidatus Bathyarchaeia archaeon]|nr:hypothetical protein [Candidatus Bathyarchaeia archaeon]
MPMFTRILTTTERKRIQSYLREDGKKSTPIRQLVTRSKQYLPAIEQDLILIKKLLDHYEKGGLRR